MKYKEIISGICYALAALYYLVKGNIALFLVYLTLAVIHIEYAELRKTFPKLFSLGQFKSIARLTVRNIAWILLLATVLILLLGINGAG